MNPCEDSNGRRHSQSTCSLTESKSIQVRVDATNILNHPVPSNFTNSLNSMNVLGVITGKTNAHREFQGQLRLSF